MTVFSPLILRVLLAVLAAAWLPMRCCSAATPAATAAAAECARPCCGETSRPAHRPTRDGPCDCGMHPSSGSVLAADAAHLTGGAALDAATFALPPTAVFLTADAYALPPTPRRFESPPDAKPAAPTLRALGVLLTV